jgi:HK97 family phage portal protein
LAAALGAGRSSDAGITITPDKAFEVSAFYAGTKIIAEDLGGLPFFLYQRSKDHKETEKARDHDLFPILHDLVNPDVSSGEFVEALTAHSIIAQNGFAHIERSRTKRIVWLMPWQPDEVRLDRDKKGRLVYLRKDGNQQEKTWPRKDVFHLKGFTLDGYGGDDLLMRAKQVLGLGLASQKYASTFFANDATPGIVVRFPTGAPKLNADGIKNFKDAWKAWFQANPHEPGVVQDGAEVEVIQRDNDKAQLIEQRRFQVIEVCRLLRLAPYKLADLEHGTYSNVEQAARDHIQHALSPHRRRWRDAVHRCLFTRDEQLEGRLYAEHSVEAMQRGNFKEQAEGWGKLLEKGVLTVNQVRRWMNLNPIEGGDAAFVQMNMQSIADAAKGVVKGASNGSGNQSATV